jgi:hypothetical protein
MQCWWCNRPGTERLLTVWRADTFVLRNPVLCDLCSELLPLQDGVMPNPRFLRDLEAASARGEARSRSEPEHVSAPVEERPWAPSSGAVDHDRQPVVAADPHAVDP